MANEPNNPEFYNREFSEKLDGQAVMPGFEEKPAETHPFIKKAVLLLWNNINMAQFNALKKAERAEFEELFISLIGEIAADTEKDPTAPADDPASPNFDIKAFRQSLEKAGGFNDVILYFDEIILEAMAQLEDYELSPEAREGLAELSAMIKDAAKEQLLKLSAFVQSELYKELKAIVTQTAAYLREYKPQFDAIFEAAKMLQQPFTDEEKAGLAELNRIATDVRGLIPFLQQELDEAQNDPQFAGKTVKDILRHGLTIRGEITESPYKPLIERAKKRREEYEAAAATVEETEHIIDELQTIQGITPRSHVMPNNPLMNDLTGKPAINAGEYDMTVINATKKQKEITAYTMITFDPGETDITITDAKLSEYERQVSDAIVSLWIEAKEQNLPPIFTADMIFRAMPGGGDKASPQQRGAITKTIEKFRRLRIYVDATAEAKRRGFDLKGGKYVFDEFYLQVRRHTFQIKNGGAVVQGYEVLSQPIILTYCKLTKQLLTTPADNILIREVKNGVITPVPLMMNANRQALTGYMLRRILIMKRSRADAQEKKRSYDAKRKKAAKTGENLPEKPLEDFIEQKPVILFATMFAETGTATDNRQQTQYNRDFCCSVLDFWQAKGLIKGYSIRKTGRAITALEIDL